jgi:hypothetical protein
MFFENNNDIKIHDLKFNVPRGYGKPLYTPSINYLKFIEL